MRERWVMIGCEWLRCNIFHASWFHIRFTLMHGTLVFGWNDNRLRRIGHAKRLRTESQPKHPITNWTECNSIIMLATWNGNWMLMHMNSLTGCVVCGDDSPLLAHSLTRSLVPPHNLPELLYQEEVLRWINCLLSYLLSLIILLFRDSREYQPVSTSAKVVSFVIHTLTLVFTGSEWIFIKTKLCNWTICNM